MRELESAIIRATHLARNGTIEAEDLGLSGVPGLAAAPMGVDASRPYKTEKARVMEAFERQYLFRLMKQYCGNVSQAARAAGKERRDLGKLLKRHAVDPRQFAA